MDDDLQEVAAAWLRAAERVGWGVEGPEGARETTNVLEALAGATRPDATELARLRRRVGGRTLGSRPVDALHEAADLLGQAAVSRGRRRAELVSAARGWLAVADPSDA